MGEGNGGAWVSENEFASIHEDIRAMAASMHNKGVETLHMSSDTRGRVFVQLGYALFASCGCGGCAAAETDRPPPGPPTEEACANEPPPELASPWPVGHQAVGHAASWSHEAVN